MSLLLLEPRTWVCISLFLSFELSDVPLTSAFPCDSESTPLQLKLNDLAEAITKTGSIAGGLLCVSLLLRYFFEPGTANPQRYFDASSLLSKY
jgi:hypothetical protein